MCKNKFIGLSLLAFVGSTVALATPKLPTFEGAEHMAIAKKIRLHFTAGDEGKMDYALPLDNGLKLTYSNIVALGDFYGKPEQPISTAQTEELRNKTFLAGLTMFSSDIKSIPELQKILGVLYQEQQDVSDGMKKGEKPEDIYDKIAFENNRQWNCITGGGCGKTWWMKPGRYMQLAITDYDHFGDNAWIAYQVGHHLALAEAIRANHSHEPAGLERAYLIDAFACHFLTDRFAAGHIRIPRMELATQVTPSIIGNALSTFMHDEENEYGFAVHNLRGDHWVVYGDRYYFDAKSDENNRHVEEALQVSADQIFTAYQQGVVLQDDAIAQLLPRADALGNDQSTDIAPLFYWNAAEQNLYRRTDLANVNDHHWTIDWWGWSTLIELSRLHKIPVMTQVSLVNAGLGEKALQDGLITDARIIAQLKQRKQ